MKFGKRFGLLAATAALTLMPAVGSLAQGTCSLAAADCTALSTADANLAKETSFAMEFEFSLDVKGDSPASAQASGTGQFAVDPKISMTDPTAAANGIQFQLDAKASSSGSSSSSGSVSVVITNGVIYFKTDKQDWQGAKLADVFKSIQSQMAGLGGGFGGSGSANSAGAAQMAQMFSDPDVMSAIASIANIKGFITLEKTSNTPALEGQNMSEFVETISPAALLSSPDFATAMKTILAAAAKANPSAATGMNPDQITALLPMVGGMIGDTNLKITRWVGQTDNMYHALGLDLNLNINPGAFGGGSASPTTGTVHFLIKLTKVGQPVTVTAPSGAKMIDMSGALSGGGAVGGSSSAGATPTASS